MLEFSVVSDLRGTSSAAARIDAFCTAHGLAPGICFDITLAVDELVTNTFGYGYDDGGEHLIDLVLRLEGGTPVVEIADDGRAFDPLQAPKRDSSAPLVDHAKGGLGTYFVRKTMDALAWRREDGRNAVTLTKRTAPDDAS